MRLRPQKMSEQPKKRPKSKRLNTSVKKIWESILKDVEKNEVPINCLEHISLKLTDGTVVDINIIELLNDGHDPEVLEEMINSRLEALDDFIDDVDFYINVDSVAKTVQPFTDDILKKLS